MRTLFPKVELAKTFARLELESESTDVAGAPSDSGERDATTFHNEGSITSYHWRLSCLALLHRYFSLRLQFLWNELMNAIESDFPNLDPLPASLADSRSQRLSRDEESTSDDGDKVVISFATTTAAPGTAAPATEAAAPSISRESSGPPTLRLPRSSFSRISPAFSAMISSENSFIEGRAGQVNFSNISADDFLLFLRLMDCFRQSSAEADQSIEKVSESAEKVSESAEKETDSPATHSSEIKGSKEKSPKRRVERAESNLNPSVGKSTTKTPWLDSVAARCFDEGEERQSSNNNNNNANLYQRTDLALRSLLSVLQFSHQYLVAVDGPSRGGETQYGHQNKSSSFLYGPLLLMARVIVENGRYVQISTMLDILGFLFMMVEDRYVDCASHDPHGRLYDESFKNKMSGGERDLHFSIGKTLSETKLLLDICRTTLKAVL